MKRCPWIMSELIPQPTPVILQVGSGDWLRQHDAIERLNIQAHQSAQCRSDEYTVDALVTHERLSHLVHELLVAEVKRCCIALFPGHSSPFKQAASCCSNRWEMCGP